MNQYPEEDHDLSNFQQSQMPQKFLLFEFISDSEKLIAIKTPKLSAKARGIYHETCIKTKKIFMNKLKSLLIQQIVNKNQGKF